MSWVAVAIGGAAVLGAGVSIYASGQASDAASEASQVQAQSQREANAMYSSEFEQTRADLQKALDAGIIDLDTANAAANAALTGGFAAARDILEPAFTSAIEEIRPFTGMEEYNLARDYLQDPSKAFTLPGVQFQYETGEKALGNILSKTTGGGVSGDIIKAAQQFGQNFASTQLDTALNRLFPFIDLSNQARTNIASLLAQKGGVLAGLETEEGIRMANLAANLGGAKANLRSTAAGGEGSFVAQALPGLTQGITNVGTIQAQGLINQANIGTNLATQLSGIGSNAAESLLLRDILSKSGYGGGGVSTFSGSVNTGSLSPSIYSGLSPGTLQY